jgi:hypothetical protein
MGMYTTMLAGFFIGCKDVVGRLFVSMQLETTMWEMNEKKRYSN